MLQRLKSWVSLFFWLERILFEPGAEVGLDLDGAALVDLGGAGFDANHAGAEIEVPRQQFADLAIFPVGANACKEREGKEWNEEALGLEGGTAPGGTAVGLEKGHQRLGLIGGQGFSQAEGPGIRQEATITASRHNKTRYF